MCPDLGLFQFLTNLVFSIAKYYILNFFSKMETTTVNPKNLSNFLTIFIFDFLCLEKYLWREQGFPGDESSCNWSRTMWTQVTDLSYC